MPPKMGIEFEDILVNVGSFGRYQKILTFVVLVPTAAAVAMYYLDVVFLTSTPDHWCNVPEVRYSNLSFNEQMQLIRPKNDPSCSTYDVNFTSLILIRNFSDLHESPTMRCPNGWQYDKSEFEATSVTRWNMVCSDRHYSSLVTSMVFCGDVFGTPLFGYLSDRIGRRSVYFLLSLLTGLSELGSTLIPNFVSFFVFRAVNGGLITVLYISSYIMVLELVGSKERAKINGTASASWTLGLCILPLAAWLTRHWVYLSIFCSLFAFSFLFFWKLLPESPRWLIEKGRYEEAFQTLKKVGQRNGKKALQSDELMQQIRKLGEKMKKEKESQSKQSSLDLVKYPQLRKRFFLLTMCWIGSSIPYYGLVINVKNLWGNQFLNFFLMAVLEFPSHLLTWYCLEKIGRRPSAIGAFLFTGTVCLFPILLRNGSPIVSVVASLLGKFGSSSSYMTMYQQGPELFPTPLRSFGMSCSATIAVTTTLSVPYIVDLAMIEKFLPFVVFSLVSYCAAASAIFLPETLNKPLPQTVADVERTFKDYSGKTTSRLGIRLKNFLFCRKGENYSVESLPNTALPSQVPIHVIALPRDRDTIAVS